MESEIETTDFNKKEGWIGKIKDWSYENWQTILVILIVLIVGVSAYNYNQQSNPSNKNQSSVAIIDNNESENVTENKMVEEENVNQEEMGNKEVSEADIENKDQIKATEKDNQEEKNENEEDNNSVISSSDDSGKLYTVYAVQGEGITHLARRALNEYLQEIEEELKLTGEHKIYVEDYLQNRIGSESIEIDHQEIFSENLIKEAISSAKQLTPKSLDNLKKYSK